MKNPAFHYKKMNEKQCFSYTPICHQATNTLIINPIVITRILRFSKIPVRKKLHTILREQKRSEFSYFPVLRTKKRHNCCHALIAPPRHIPKSAQRPLCARRRPAMSAAQICQGVACCAIILCHSLAPMHQRGSR